MGAAASVEEEKFVTACSEEDILHAEHVEASSSCKAARHLEISAAATRKQCEKNLAFFKVVPVFSTLRFLMALVFRIIHSG
jgi:hypothetical protein